MSEVLGGLEGVWVSRAEQLADPRKQPRDWNRSFELSTEQPRGAVLLLHGMSDSPYSLRALAERLHAEGLHVVGLRYPGHGTAPASLTRTTWEDMYGAVALAARHLRGALGDKPLYVFGYSTGAPLAVELSLQGLADQTIPLPDGLVRVFRKNGREGMSFLGEQLVRYVPVKAPIEVVSLSWLTP